MTTQDARQIDWNDFADEIADYTGLEREEIRPELAIYDDLGMDSLGLFSLGMHLQKVFAVAVPVSSVATLQTLENIFVLLNRLLKTTQ